MANQILSVDIRDEVLHAAILEQHGNGLLVHASVHAPVTSLAASTLAASLDELLDQLDQIPSTAVIGLPLSLASLRNVRLPFTERKKIAQVLPLELEDQLLAPVDQYILDFTITGRQAEGSSVLVAAVDREIVAQQLEILAGRDCVVKSILLTTEVLCHACMRSRPTGESILLLCGDHQALQMALWQQDRVVFLRRIPWPEPLFPPQGTAATEQRAVLAEKTIRDVMTSVSEQIRVSLYYLQGWQETPSPEHVLLAGCLTDTDLSEPLVEKLRLAGSVCSPGRDRPGPAPDTAAAQQSNPAFPGVCIELAVAAQQRRTRQKLLNFLTGEFAPGAEQYLSRKTLQLAGMGLGLLAAAIIAFLWAGERRLDSRAADLLDRMNAIYHQTFPDGPEKVERPFLFMQSRMREMEGTEVALPLFSGKKRILDILADISKRIPEDLDLHVSRLVVDSQGIQLKGTTDAFNNVDLIKNRLAASGRYAAVKIVSATADKKKGRIRFVIHLQLGEAS